MKKHKGLTIAGTFVLVVVVLILVLPLVLNVNQFRPTIESKLQENLGRAVTIGDLHLSLFSGGITASDITVADDPNYSQQPFLEAKSLEVGVDLAPLIFSRTLHVNSLTLRDPELHLVRGSGGKWNFSSLGAPPNAPTQRNPHSKNRRNSRPAATPSPVPDLAVGSLGIVDGKVFISSLANPSRLLVYEDVQVKAYNVGFGRPVPFNFSATTPGGGGLKIDGYAGPVTRDDMAASPLRVNMLVKHMDLARTGFLESSSGVAGLLDFQGTVRSDGGKLSTDGKATTQKLRLVRSGGPARQPVTFDYSADYDLRRQTGVVTRGILESGRTGAIISGRYLKQGDSTIVHMKLHGNNMPLSEVQGLLPAFGVNLPAGSSFQGGTLSANLNIDGPLDHLVISGPLNVSNTRLAGFSMASGIAKTMNGSHDGRDTIIQTLSSTLRVAPDGIQASNVQLILPQMGTITGNGNISPSNALDFHMLAKMNSGSGFMGGWFRSKGQIPFLIQGTTSNPVFAPDMGKSLGNMITNPAKGVGSSFGGLFGKKKQN